MTELKPCPYCGGEAQLKMVGDMKHLLMYECENKSCFGTPLCGGDARSTERGARKIWNRRAQQKRWDKAKARRARNDK